MKNEVIENLSEPLVLKSNKVKIKQHKYLQKSMLPRVRIKRIAIAKCDPFFNYRDAKVANSTKFAIPNFVRNISFLRFFFQVVTFCVLSRHFL